MRFSRHFLLVIVSISFLAATLSAQTMLAVRGGASIANFVGSDPDVDELDSRTGINVGASATFPLSESVGV